MMCYLVITPRQVRHMAGLRVRAFEIPEVLQLLRTGRTLVRHCRATLY